MIDKHTPGPWRVVEVDPAAAAGFAYVIKHVPLGPNDVPWPVALSCCPADANLIAAAPALLEALEWIQVNSRTIRHARAVAAKAIEEAK